MDIQVSSPNAVYIKINKVTYYIDESIEEGTIIECWHEGDEYDIDDRSRSKRNKIKFASSTLTNHFNSNL